MKFTPQEVYACVRDQTYPMKTSEVADEMRRKYGVHWNIPINVTTDLAALARSGDLVTAKHGEAANPYAFIVRQGDRASRWWMDKRQADEFRKNLEWLKERRDKAAAAILRVAARADPDAPGDWWNIEVNERTGAIKVTLKMTEAAALWLDLATTTEED